MLGIVLALAALIVSVAPISAHELKVGELVIVHPMVDEAAKGQTIAHGSLEIRNEGSVPDQLLSIETEFAGKSELEGGKAVPIPPHTRAAVLLLFHSINQTLTEDWIYGGTLTFEKAGKIKIEITGHHHPH